MELGLNGRVALVTGGSKGIGRAIVQALVEEGVRVAVTARGAEALRKTALELSGFDILTVPADAIDQKAASSVVARVVDVFGGLDVLINNVGGAGRFGGFRDLTDIDWRNAFNLNVLSLVHFVQAADQYLRSSKSGRIINLSSIAGLQPGAFNPHYSVTKAATINLSKFLADYFVKDGVLVNVVCPGPVHSESWEENVHRLALERHITVEEARQQVEREESSKIPLGRIGECKDVAGLVVFLASERAAWVTGSCFHVNGGKLKTIW
ncbi:MAG: SDR family oxidoreductase [Gammaproteobacteria bacterium]|nr:SDR family oxidoreductase [Gammaproteobacteria bacterium]